MNSRIDEPMGVCYGGIRLRMRVSRERADELLIIRGNR